MTAENVNIKQAIDTLATNFEEYKSVLKEVAKQEAKGAVDPLLREQLNRTNEALSIAEDAKEKAEKGLLITQRFEALKSEVKSMDPEQAKQRREWLDIFRKGDIQNPKNTKFADSLEIGKKSFSSSSNPDGAFGIIPYLDRAILQIMKEVTPMRRLASQITISNTDEYKRPVSIDNDDVYWADDHASRTHTEPNQYKVLSIKVGNLVANVKVPQNLIEDVYFDLEQDIINQTARKYEYREGKEFIDGDGVEKPKGILKYPAGTNWGQIEQIALGASNSITYDGLINLVYSVKDRYEARSAFMMHRTTVAELRKLATASGQPLWQPSLIPGQPSTFLGYPIHRAPNMPVVATNSLAIIFGDFSEGYKIVDRLGITLLRDPYSEHPNVCFKFTKRVGGGVENFEAIKIGKIST